MKVFCDTKVIRKANDMTTTKQNSLETQSELEKQMNFQIYICPQVPDVSKQNELETQSELEKQINVKKIRTRRFKTPLKNF